MEVEKKPFLRDEQREAIKRMRNGCILNGGTGSGKSRAGIAYYCKEHGGSMGPDPGFIPMKNPKDLYIITTAKKRDDLDWQKELAPFRITTHDELKIYDHKIVIDSWNNIKKYSSVKNAFFIFDEQRLVGSGAWVKSFYKIAKFNNWILLSATPGDTWMDYIPVFVANGFYKNKSEFIREHVVYNQFANYPTVSRYVATGKLIRLRNMLLIDMDVARHTIQHHENVYCAYDICKYKDVMRNRWNPYTDEPITDAAGLCHVLRRVVNSDDSRVIKLIELLEDHPKAIIFYNFNYELDILRNLYYGEDVKVAEWNGHNHQPVPDGERWIYLVQYTAGCEGWNCIKTDTIIFFSQNYSYKVMAQAIGRIDRLNTPFIDLYYYHFKSRSGIDLAISKALDGKKKFNEKKFAGW